MYFLLSCPYPFTYETRLEGLLNMSVSGTVYWYLAIPGQESQCRIYK